MIGFFLLLMCNIMSGQVKRNDSFSTMLGGGRWFDSLAKTIDLAKLWLTGVCMMSKTYWVGDGSMSNFF